MFLNKYITYFSLLLTLIITIAGCGSDGGSGGNRSSDSSAANPVAGTSLNLAWDPPSMNKNGSALIDLAGFKLYYGLFSKNYSEYVDAGNSNGVEVKGLITGTVYCFAVTAYDTSGNESDYSDEVCAKI